MVEPENEGDPQVRNDLTFFHGVLYLEQDNKWVFESFKDSLQAKDF